jgi:8-oxo-dGTP pyrophosphatase MutT (NUDIX family)
MLTALRAHSKKVIMVIIRNAAVHQYGALPFAITEKGEIRVLLVTTRGKGRWIIPKGWRIPKLTAAATAAREAYEEAGVIGTIVGDSPVGCYSYEKQRTSRTVMLCEVSVFLFAVERQLRKWPEKSERETQWFTPEQAAARVAPMGLADILRTVTRQVLVASGGFSRSATLSSATSGALASS